MLSCILPRPSRQRSKGGEGWLVWCEEASRGTGLLGDISTPLLSGSPSKRSSACRCMRESEQHTKALPYSPRQAMAQSLGYALANDINHL
jgi:hypothetical protein